MDRRWQLWRLESIYELISKSCIRHRQQILVTEINLNTAAGSFPRLALKALFLE
jgi:hypothetical protein